MTTNSLNRTGMHRFRGTFRLLVAVSILALVYLVIDMDSNRPPSPEAIRNWEGVQPFILEERGLKGHFRVLDVDSLVLSYFSATTEGGFCESVTSRARLSRWKIAPGPQGTMCFERITKPKTAKGTAWYVERVQVMRNPANGYVVVGWVRADSHVRVEAFAETSEAIWAEKAVWPLVSRLLHEPVGETADGP